LSSQFASQISTKYAAYKIGQKNNQFVTALLSGVLSTVIQASLLKMEKGFLGGKEGFEKLEANFLEGAIKGALYQYLEKLQEDGKINEEWGEFSEGFGIQVLEGINYEKIAKSLNSAVENFGGKLKDAAGVVINKVGDIVGIIYKDSKTKKNIYQDMTGERTVLEEGQRVVQMSDLKQGTNSVEENALVVSSFNGNVIDPITHYAEGENGEFLAIKLIKDEKGGMLFVADAEENEQTFEGDNIQYKKNGKNVTIILKGDKTSKFISYDMKNNSYKIMNVDSTIAAANYDDKTGEFKGVVYIDDKGSVSYKNITGKINLLSNVADALNCGVSSLNLNEFAVEVYKNMVMGKTDMSLKQRKDFNNDFVRKNKDIRQTIESSNSYKMQRALITYKEKTNDYNSLSHQEIIDIKQELKDSFLSLNMGEIMEWGRLNPVFSEMKSSLLMKNSSFRDIGVNPDAITYSEFEGALVSFEKTKNLNRSLGKLDGTNALLKDVYLRNREGFLSGNISQYVKLVNENLRSTNEIISSSKEYEIKKGQMINKSGNLEERYFLIDYSKDSLKDMPGSIDITSMYYPVKGGEGFLLKSEIVRKGGKLYLEKTPYSFEKFMESHKVLSFGRNNQDRLLSSNEQNFKTMDYIVDTLKKSGTYSNNSGLLLNMSAGGQVIGVPLMVAGTIESCLGSTIEVFKDFVDKGLVTDEINGVPVSNLYNLSDYSHITEIDTKVLTESLINLFGATVSIDMARAGASKLLSNIVSGEFAAASAIVGNISDAKRATTMGLLVDHSQVISTIKTDNDEYIWQYQVFTKDGTTHIFNVITDQEERGKVAA